MNVKEAYKPVPNWMSTEAQHTLSKGYLLPGETPRDMWWRVAKAAEDRLVKMGWQKDFELAEELMYALYKGWAGLASPVASNMGTTRALPISCYSLSISDSLTSIYSHQKEAARLTQEGGGVGINLSKLRHRGAPISRGGKSTGILPWALLYDLTAKVVTQGSVRRGSFAFYIDIDHPDLPEVLLAKDHTQGSKENFLDSTVAVNITDKWMEEMLAGDEAKFKIFSDVIKCRMQCGVPYILFVDRVNEMSPQCYKDRNLMVEMSNLCIEMAQYTDEDHTLVCALSSLNLYKLFEWKDWRSASGRSLPQLMIWLLEAVMEEFLVHAKQRAVGMGRAIRAATKGRALGLGTMGLHMLYQSQGLPFESEEARKLNIEAHRFINEEAKVASRELADLFGEPEWCEGSGYRHTHRTAIAPTKTNSIISGAFSQGIEPVDSNVFSALQAKGDYIRKNPELEKLLDSKGMNTPSVWNRIIGDEGSVQKLDFLTKEEKQVFLTFREISQWEILRQAADRGPLVDQGVSTNLKFDDDTPAEELLGIHIAAWKAGTIKSLYYLKSRNSLTKSRGGTYYVITKSNCPYCEKLKQELQEVENLKEIDIEDAKECGLWQEEWKTVPQLWVDGERIGGYEDYMSRVKGNAIVNDEEASCQACEA